LRLDFLFLYQRKKVMSHTLYTANVQRVQRCELAVPGTSPEMFEKALKSGVDVIFLDLEDAVAPDDKLRARKNVIQAINDLDWRGHGITVSVRINGLDTQYMVRDVVDLVEQAGSKIDTILIPKVGVYSDVYMVESMLNQLEMQQGLKNKIGIEALIETALGMANVEDIAKQGALGGRLEALHFGVADYAASNRARTVNIGGLNPDYPGDQWHFALSRMTVACRAYGLRPIDGPFGDIKDPEGYILGAKRAAALGCEGKWAIHPSQIALANDVFTPPESEVTKAKRILEALKEAAAQGKGAAALDGRLIDAASERMANNVVRAAEAIAAKTK
jgi:citrate lyase subunit beta/citryl-CoA lyase